MDFGVAASIVSFYPGQTWIEALGALVGYTKSTLDYSIYNLRAGVFAGISKYSWDFLLGLSNISEFP